MAFFVNAAAILVVMRNVVISRLPLSAQFSSASKSSCASRASAKASKAAAASEVKCSVSP